MPTIERYSGYRFYFYSHEPNEPPHMHVDKGGATAKIWIDPPALARNLGYKPKELAIDNVRFDDDRLVVDLKDGRTIAVPLAWYPRLFTAKETQRNNWQISGAGYGIHWPEIDEDLSIEGLLRGAPAPKSAS
jgi:hypothetical protein